MARAATQASPRGVCSLLTKSIAAALALTALVTTVDSAHVKVFRRVASATDLRAATLSAAPKPTPSNAPSDGGSGKGGCKVMVGSACYASLSAAVKKAPAGGAVMVRSDITVTDEIKIDKSVAIVGDAGNFTITAKLGSKRGATIFRGTAANVTFQLSNLHFRNDDKVASVFRTVDQGTNRFVGEGDPGPVSLDVEGCSFVGFFTDLRGGSVFSMATARRVSIRRSTFNNNTVFFEEEMYEGGGAVWIFTAEGDFAFTGNSFYGNKQLFGHGLGGAIALNNLTGSLEIRDNEFIENVANGGGAIYIGNMSTYDTTATINSKFVRNRAQDNGWKSGSRGGAVWVAQVRGVLSVDGIYDGNECVGDRGGAFANNRIYGTVNFGGVYTNNRANTTRGASAWDTHYDNSGKFNNKATIGTGNTIPAINLEEGKEYKGDDKE